MANRTPVFEPVPSQPDWPALERDILARWQADRAFERLTELNAEGEPWSFQDGPITANNPMGVHHAWGRTYKDLWQRFFAQQGRSERWQNGFDCQGLWVEVNVEKNLGFNSKRDIEAYGVAKFGRACKAQVLRMAALQTEQSMRLGMWVHWDNPDTLRWLADHLDEEEPVTVDTPSGPVTDTVERLVGKLGHEPWNGSYFTFSDINNYLIWHFVKSCHARGWVYKGHDVMPWCTRCGTGISHHEIATEGYREITHKSPIVRFPLLGPHRDGNRGGDPEDQPDSAGKGGEDPAANQPLESLLVWTTTPWTLASNVAAAVGPDLTYLRVKQGEDIFYLAEGTAKATLKGKAGEDYEVLGQLKGSDLVGRRYRGPFDELPAQAEAREVHRVIPWDAVGADEGTGIVHIAPGAGAEDYALGKEHGLPVVASLDESGHFLPQGFDWLAGHHALQIAEEIFANLRAKGLLYHLAPYTHRYPVCWRCQTELVFRLVDEWFISMGPLVDKPRSALAAEEKAGSLRHQMMDAVDEARWIPAWGRDREQDWLRNMGDWMISKKRYWGLALPIWECADCGWFDVIGGREELKARAIAGWEDFDGHTPHRPYVDAVEIKCQACGANARRIPDVGNPWLDAGIVSMSTLPHPGDPADKAKWFPADFITENLAGQFRNWFYSLLAMSTALEGRSPFKNVLGYATLVAEDGRDMHKSTGNMVEFNDGAERMGADVMRWMYLAHKPEVNLRFGYGPGNEVRRRFLIPLWNVYAFFVQYANASDWTPPARFDAGERRAKAFVARHASPSPSAAEMDRWVVLRTTETAARVSERLTDYDAQRATAELEALVEDVSNWYVRRSRRRFWDGDAAALDTLHFVLMTLTQILAPMIPFTAEAIYQNLRRGAPAGTPESVHHTLWPLSPVLSAEDQRILTEMTLVVRLAALGRAARSAADQKLRQPLARALVAVRSQSEADAVGRLQAHLLDELNVKAIEVVRDQGTLVSFSLRPVLPKLGPRFGQQVPAIRQALSQADATAVAAAVAAGEPIELPLASGETITLNADDIEVMATAKPGLATAEEAGYVVGLETALTPELIAEGIARDLVRAVQQLRKDSGLDISDRITLSIATTDALWEAVEAHSDYLMGETLATSLVCADLTGADGETTVEVEGKLVTIALKRATE